MIDYSREFQLAMLKRLDAEEKLARCRESRATWMSIAIIAILTIGAMLIFL